MCTERENLREEDVDRSSACAGRDVHSKSASQESELCLAGHSTTPSPPFRYYR